MSDLSGSVRVEPAALISMADSIDNHAKRVEQRLQEMIAKLENLIESGGFEGLSARATLWQLQEQKPTLLMWSKRLQAYAMRLRVTSEAIKKADTANTSPSHPRADSFVQVHGISRDHGYQKLLEAEIKLEDERSQRDSIAMSLMAQRMRLAELLAQLADYDEVSGRDLATYLEDASEYFSTRLSGSRETLEKEISVLQTSIGDQEHSLTQADEHIRQLMTEADLKAEDINSRIQNVGGHDVLFNQRMSEQPIAEEGYCLKFVVDWRPDINEGFGSAANLITENHSSVAPFRYQIDATTSLLNRILPGDLVVWNRGQQGADSQHGHVAIIMQIHDDYVIVKESSWDGVVDTWREVPRSKLQELTFIGQPLQYWPTPDKME